MTFEADLNAVLDSIVAYGKQGVLGSTIQRRSIGLAAGAEPGTANKLFISYRRDDSADIAARIFRWLERRYGRSNIFRDLASIQKGTDCVRVIDEAISQCAMKFVLVGPRWLDIKSADGRPRLDSQEDLVRLEIEAGLSRNMLVVPPMLNGASMPSERELPGELGQLARRDSMPMADRTFARDIGRLKDSIERQPHWRRRWPAKLAATLGWR